MGLYPWPVAAAGQCDSASLAVAPPPPRFCCKYHKIFHFLTMAGMRASPPSLPPISVAAGWRNRDSPTKKWQCPCGKVLPIVQTPQIRNAKLLLGPLGGHTDSHAFALPLELGMHVWYRARIEQLFARLWHLAAPVSCTNQSVFCCMLRNFAFGGKSVTPPYGPWENLLPLVWTNQSNSAATQDEAEDEAEVCVLCC